MINPNKYSEHKALHSKCLAILEAQEEFIRRLNSAEDHLAKFDKADNGAPIRLMNYRWQLEHRVELLEHTVERMQGYYDRNAAKMCSLLSTAKSGKYYWEVTIEKSFSFPDWMFEGMTDSNIISYGQAELTSHLIEPINVPYDTDPN